ncbi:MAG: 3-isopropylmalate dehydratase small subunit [Desulfurococcaceae archaeon]|nr:3-isopropylmalate dehydratase small subunit [Desulfurococcaceae archaeon]
MVGRRVIEGRVLVVGDNVDTDAIVPGRYLTITDPRELGKHALEGLDPSIPEKLRERSIIVAGRNFGCGSSREHAVLALIGAGVRAVIAESFARIFYRNAINRGLLVLEAPGIRQRVRDGDTVVVDLDRGVVRLPTGEEVQFKPIAREVLEIVEAGGLIEKLRKELQHGEH